MATVYQSQILFGQVNTTVSCFLTVATPNKSHTAESATAVALGGCFFFSVFEINFSLEFFLEPRGVSVAGLVGELLSLLSLVRNKKFM